MLAITCVGFAESAIHPIRSVNTSERVVALTFDDGPDPRYTPRILALLKIMGIRATFFQVGKQVEKYPEIAKAVAAEGHVIGNHTYSHMDLGSATLEQIQAEIENCEKAIVNATGQRPTLFRPPKGHYNETLNQILEQNNYNLILWRLCVEHKPAPTSIDMACRIIAKVRPGTIILAHDGRLNRDKDIEALPLIISHLKEKGYKFVTIPELINIERKSQNLLSSKSKTSQPNPERQSKSPNRISWLHSIKKHLRLSH
jgi:peptidoglycan/xylan/chitin deacetylase (PgdA/CDA1 family)